MGKVTVSTKYQVVIPKDVRLQTGIVPGEQLNILVKGDVISLVADRPIQKLRGIARGAGGKGLREKKDRL